MMTLTLMIICCSRARRKLTLRRHSNTSETSAVVIIVSTMMIDDERWLVTHIMLRYGANPIPVWVLPYGRCWRDPRHPQGIAAVKVSKVSESTIWLLEPFGRPSGWLGGEHLVDYCGTPVWRWHKMTTVMFSIGQTNIQQASSGHSVGFWIHRLIIWLLWRPTLCFQFVKT